MTWARLNALAPVLGTRDEHDTLTRLVLDTRDVDVRVEVTGPVLKRCPVKHEDDHGTATITWRTEGATLELHTLAALLHTYANVEMTHEAFVVDVADGLTDVLGSDVDVTSQWSTAGLGVHVALPRQPRRLERRP